MGGEEGGKRRAGGRKTGKKEMGEEERGKGEGRRGEEEGNWRKEEGSLVTECSLPARPLQSNIIIPISQMWRTRLKEVT